MENAKKFFEEILKTEEAKALLAAVEKPETEEAQTAAYLDIAKKLNVELTAEEIAAYFSAAKPASGELDDEELAQLSGGGDTCEYSYINSENCWVQDGCDRAFGSYSSYTCNSTAKVDEAIKSLLS